MAKRVFYVLFVEDDGDAESGPCVHSFHDYYVTEVDKSLSDEDLFKSVEKEICEKYSDYYGFAGCVVEKRATFKEYAEFRRQIKKEEACLIEMGVM